MLNNVIHNPGKRVMQFGFVPSQWKGHATQRGVMVIVGNVAHKGPSTAVEIAFLDSTGPCDVHLKDNLFFDASGMSLSVAPGFRDAQGRLSARDPRNELLLVASPPF